MDSKGLSGGIYKPLSPEGIETIHDASLTILEKTGITYEAGLEETVGMLAEAGATIDRGASRIRFSRELIREQVAKAPSQVILYARDGKNDLDLTEDKVHLGTGGAAVKILDLETGEPRPSTLNDLYDLGRLVDRLDHIHFFLRPCIPTDIPEADYDVNMFYACLKATGKHVMSGVNDEAGLHRIIDMAAMLAGGKEQLRAKPFISVITSFAISPLKLCTQSTRIMQECNRQGIPVALSAAPMSGSTSPMTMSGTLAQLHAEQMAGITICQLTNPAAPLLYGGIPGMANMATMGYLGGGVECGMMNAAIHQLAAHINVPNYNSAGLTDAKLPDAQAGWEKAMTILLGAMGGSNYMHHSAGMLESMLTVAPEQFVIDDEIIGMACKVLKGIEVDADHLAMEVIDSVGPAGNFMMAPHTMKYMRSEYFQSNGVTDRNIRHQWEQGGSLDTRDRAKNIARKILASEETPYIPSDIDQAMREQFNILL
ncbi:MAG: trimethylamine methyltransferase family protein [Desulfosarcina sp.]|nr:trimethylamine methyltransferase family protein [Desulfosarcina sp.]MBC2742805.1 trimethylamine methyltransferase family protein [Desulfosarcina sp.]MBC2765715.1 trimethylamine methyltransferase [Desulfosarcina sp.]